MQEQITGALPQLQRVSDEGSLGFLCLDTAVQCVWLDIMWILATCHINSVVSHVGLLGA